MFERHNVENANVDNTSGDVDGTSDVQFLNSRQRHHRRRRRRRLWSGYHFLLPLQNLLRIRVRFERSGSNFLTLEIFCAIEDISRHRPS